MRTFLGSDLWSSCDRYFSFRHIWFMCVFVFMAIRARRAVYEVVAGRVSLGFSCATHAWFQKITRSYLERESFDRCPTDTFGDAVSTHDSPLIILDALRSSEWVHEKPSNYRDRGFEGRITMTRGIQALCPSSYLGSF